MTIAETLTKAKTRLWWGGYSVEGQEYGQEFICFTIRDVAGYEEAVQAVDFLCTYGMDRSGGWFSRHSDDGLTYEQTSKARQNRRHAFLSVAIKHATRLGI